MYKILSLCFQSVLHYSRNRSKGERIWSFHPLSCLSSCNGHFSGLQVERKERDILRILQASITIWLEETVRHVSLLFLSFLWRSKLDLPVHVLGERGWLPFCPFRFFVFISWQTTRGQNNKEVEASKTEADKKRRRVLCNDRLSKALHWKEDRETVWQK